MRNEILKYERIRNLRIDKNLTQKEVAEILKIKQNTYSQYEIGVLNYPIDAVVKLAEFYETSVDYLLGLTDNPTPYNRKNQTVKFVFYISKLYFTAVVDCKNHLRQLYSLKY